MSRAKPDTARAVCTVPRECIRTGARFGLKESILTSKQTKVPTGIEAQWSKKFSGRLSEKPRLL